MGYAAAKLFAKRGWRVYAGARRVEKIPGGANIYALYLDVTDETSIRNFAQFAISHAPRIDVLINNAGYGEFGPLEEVGVQRVRKQLNTNLVGASELTKLVLPTMRKQGAGRIVNISSIGGDMYSPMGGWYYVTKHALNVWSDTLDSEVRQFGIRSVIVEPGGTASSWSEIAMNNAQANLRENSPYAKLTEAMVTLFNQMNSSTHATSADLARVFYQAATDTIPRHRYFYSLGDRLLGHFSRAHQATFHSLLNVVTNQLLK